MRYYAIKITGNNLPDSLTASSVAGQSGAQFCSVIGGQNDPGALDIELNIHAAQNQTVYGEGSFIRIWGVPLELIAQSNQLNNASIEVYGGMTDGLPLATFQSAEQGLLVSGSIWPAFGNWLGTEITLDLMLIQGGPGSTATSPGMGSPNKPKNVIHNWPMNTPLSQSLDNTLKVAFPDMTRVINISSNLKLNYTDVGFYNSINQFGQYIHALSMSILGKQQDYKGIVTTVKNNTITMRDNSSGSSNSGTVQIDYRDLIGQPTWIAPFTISVKTVMRADIDIGTYITLPQTLISVQSADAAKAGANSLLSSNQTYQVTDIQHFGHFRQNDSFSWVSVFQALAPGGS